MFVIDAHRVGDDGEPGKAVRVTLGFPERDIAKQYLDDLVEGAKPNSGWDAKQDYWWVRENDVVTHYVIRVDDVKARY